MKMTGGMKERASEHCTYHQPPVNCKSGSVDGDALIGTIFVGTDRGPTGARSGKVTRVVKADDKKRVMPLNSSSIFLRCYKKSLSMPTIKSKKK